MKTTYQQPELTACGGSMCGELLPANSGEATCAECVQRSQRVKPSCLTLTITGVTSAIEPAVEQIIGFIRLFGCSDAEEINISLALQEALANAVVHGCNKNPLQLASCSVDCDQNEVLITVRDPGKGFNPLAVEDCTSPECLMLNHGRGIAIIRAFMDEVSYENGGSLLRMRKRFTRAADEIPA